MKKILIYASIVLLLFIAWNLFVTIAPNTVINRTLYNQDQQQIDSSNKIQESKDLATHYHQLSRDNTRKMSNLHVQLLWISLIVIVLQIILVTRQARETE